MAWSVPAGAPAENAAATASHETARVSRGFAEARQRFLVAPTNTTLAWQFGRACFDRAEFATNNTERGLLAEQGLAACRRACRRDTNSAAARYYLGMNLGQLARTKMLAALGLVDEMEAAFQAARALDEHFDFAGPDRNLGLLYFEAPGWPASVGSRAKARQHLHRAAELAPQHPENRLNLLEAFLRWGDRQGVERELKAIEDLWPIARSNLVGETWTAAWADWEKRLKQAKARVEKQPNALVAPRQKE